MACKISCSYIKFQNQWKPLSTYFSRRSHPLWGLMFYGDCSSISNKYQLSPISSLCWGYMTFLVTWCASWKLIIILRTYSWWTLSMRFWLPKMAILSTVSTSIYRKTAPALFTMEITFCTWVKANFSFIVFLLQKMEDQTKLTWSQSTQSMCNRIQNTYFSTVWRCLMVTTCFFIRSNLSTTINWRGRSTTW